MAGRRVAVYTRPDPEKPYQYRGLVWVSGSSMRRISAQVRKRFPDVDEGWIVRQARWAGEWVNWGEWLKLEPREDEPCA